MHGIPPSSVTNRAPLRLISTSSRITLDFHVFCALLGPLFFRGGKSTGDLKKGLYRSGIFETEWRGAESKTLANTVTERWGAFQMSHFCAEHIIFSVHPCKVHSHCEVCRNAVSATICTLKGVQKLSSERHNGDIAEAPSRTNQCDVQSWPCDTFLY